LNVAFYISGLFVSMEDQHLETTNRTMEKGTFNLEYVSAGVNKVKV